MTSFGHEIHDAVARLKREAMWSCADLEGWVATEDCWEKWEGPSRYTLSYPNRENLTGGGIQRNNAGEYMNSWLAEDFATIRATVDAAFAPFADIPRPESLDYLIRVAGDAEMAMWFDKEEPEKSTISDANVVFQHKDFRLFLNYDTLMTEMSGFNGDMATAFKHGYVMQLPEVVGALRALAFVRLAALVQEAELWAATRESIRSLIDQATAKLVGVRESSIDGDPVALSILALGVGIAGALVTGGSSLAVALTATSVGLTFLQGLPQTSEEAAVPTKELPGSRPLDIVASVADFAAEIANELTRVEMLLKSNLLAVIDYVARHEHEFIFNNEGEGEPLRDKPGEIWHNPGVATDFDQALFAIASSFENSAAAYGRMYLGHKLARSGDIGVDPSAQLESVAETWWALCKQAEEKTVLVREYIYQWFTAMDEYEQSVLADVQAFLAILDQQTAHDIAADTP